MKTIAPTPSGHETARGLIHDDDFAALYKIIFITNEKELRTQRLLQVPHETRLLGVEVFGAVGIEQLNTKQRLDSAHTDLGQVDRA